MLKIFSIGKWDYAGCGYFLSEAINTYTDHHSRAAKSHESTLGFPHDLLNLTGKRTHTLWEWADVIHIHDAAGVSNIENMAPRPAVITYHGTRYRNSHRAYNILVDDRGWMGTVATPDLTRFGLPLLPDCRSDLRERWYPNAEFTVAHAPTKREVKGTKRVISACKRLGIKLDLIENVPWEECIERKARAHILVDQFELGYGCNAIEAWAMSLPVISDGAQDALFAIRGRFGYIPFVRPIPSLENALEMMRDDMAFYNNWAEIGRRHYKKYHSPEAAAARAIDYYNQAIERDLVLVPKSPKAPIRRIAGDLFTMRYTGDSAGLQTWFAEGTGLKYQCSATESLFYVYGVDKEWFLKQKDKRGRPIFAAEDSDVEV